MKVNTLLLCDAATTREGLLSILGGGVNILRQPAFPAPLGASLAILLEFDGDELKHPHKIAVEIRQDGGGPSILQMEARWDVGPADVFDPRLTNYVPLVLPLQPVGVPEPGHYRLTLSVDGQDVGALTFLMVQTGPVDAPEVVEPGVIDVE